MSNFDLTSEEKKKNGDMIKEIQTLAGKPVLSPKHLVKNTPPGTMSNNQENNLADYDDMNDDDQAPAGQNRTSLNRPMSPTPMKKTSRTKRR